MNFYNHYLGDYARDTKGLSLIEHGAYRLLLDHCYATEQPIPNDLKELCRIAGAMTPVERKAVEKIAEKFFPVNGDGRRHNRRAEIEIARAQEKSDKAKASAERRWGRNGDGDAGGMRTHSGGDANQNQKPEESKASTAEAVEARGKAAGLQTCPHELIVALYHEVLPSNPKILEWNNARRGYLRARWLEKATPKGRHPGYASTEDGIAWWRRFFAYVAESRFLTGQEEGREGRPPFVADLEWLVRPTNFAKVIEGKYHR